MNLYLRLIELFTIPLIHTIYILKNININVKLNLNGEFMGHDIFISHSSENNDIANAIYQELKSKNFKCWVDFNSITTAEHYSKEIMDGLKEAKLVVLVYSKEAQDSKFVRSEVRNAFDDDKPIICFKVDETLPSGEMEYYLKNKQWLIADSHPEDHFDELVETVRRLMPRKKDYKIPIILAVVLIAIAVVAFMTFSGSDNVETEITNSSEISIDYVGMDDDTSKGYSWKYSYFIFGSIPSQLSNSSKDVVHIEFLDDSGKVIQSNNTKISEIEGNVLGSAYLNKNNVAKVSVELKDNNGNVISKAESTNIISN